MKSVQTFCLLFLLTFFLACFNKNKTKIKVNQSDSASARLDSILMNEKIKPIGPFFGYYNSTTSCSTEMHPIMLLTSPDSFILRVNLCQGTGFIKGNFYLLDSNLKFVVTNQDFHGFSSDSQKVFLMKIISDEELIYNGMMIGCYPHNNDVFIKNEAFNE
jgi:hypothetical protein